jgi:membrane protease subunit (stomatin/prohibitin family)
VADLDGQLRGLILQHISNAIAQSGVPFLDLAANQIEFANALQNELAARFAKIGLKLDGMTVQNLSLPEELQKILDQKIGMGMVGNDMGKFMQYQTGQAIPEFGEGGSGRRRRRRRRDGPGRRRRHGPGAGAEPAAGPATRRRPRAAAAAAPAAVSPTT